MSDAEIVIVLAGLASLLASLAIGRLWFVGLIVLGIASGVVFLVVNDGGHGAGWGEGGVQFTALAAAAIIGGAVCGYLIRRAIEHQNA